MPSAVALRTEGVDRNMEDRKGDVSDIIVALRTEGVDRNSHLESRMRSKLRSPSVRRAWIEIAFPWVRLTALSVALRTEGVDRNIQHGHIAAGVLVALRTEGVDRNR